MTQGYIVIVGWEKFQHYKDRNPPWIKMYVDLLNRDEYLALSLADRGLLHDLWKLASMSGEGRVRVSRVSRDGRVTADSTLLARRLNVRRVSLEPLIQAGFIKIRASKSLPKPLARRKQNATPETETETEESARPSKSTRKRPSAPQPNGQVAMAEAVDIYRTAGGTVNDERRGALSGQLATLTKRGTSREIIHHALRDLGRRDEFTGFLMRRVSELQAAGGPCRNEGREKLYVPLAELEACPCNACQRDAAYRREHPAEPELVPEPSPAIIEPDEEIPF